MDADNVFLNVFGKEYSTLPNEEAKEYIEQAEDLGPDIEGANVLYEGKVEGT